MRRGSRRARLMHLLLALVLLHLDGLALLFGYPPRLQHDISLWGLHRYPLLLRVLGLLLRLLLRLHGGLNMGCRGAVHRHRRNQATHLLLVRRGRHGGLRRLYGDTSAGLASCGLVRTVGSGHVQLGRIVRHPVRSTGRGGHLTLVALGACLQGQLLWGVSIRNDTGITEGSVTRRGSYLSLILLALVGLGYRFS